MVTQNIAGRKGIGTGRAGWNGRRRVIVTAFAVLLAVLVIGLAGFWFVRSQREQAQRAAMQAPPITGVSAVAAQDFTFQQPNIQVAAGATVTWTNQDGAAHNVVFSDGGPHSELLQQGQRYSYTFATPGTYDYVCALHSEMVGRVTVVR